MEGYVELRAMLQEGLAVRREREANWMRWRNMYRYASTDAPSSFLRTDSEVHIHMVRTYLRILLPSLYFKDPHVVVRPLLFNDEDAMTAATRMEAMINYYLSTPHILRMKPNARASILDALILNEGYIENRWRYEAEEQPKQGAGERLTYDVAVVDAPYVGRVSAYDIAYDPYSLEGLDGARWVARRKWLPISAVRDNKAYNASVRNKVEQPDRVNSKKLMYNIISALGLKSLKNRSQENLEASLDAMYEGLVQVWGLTDLKYNRYVEFIPNIEGFLVDGENPYGHLTKFNIKQLTFPYDTDAEQPASLIEDIIPQARELNHINSRQHEAIRRFSRMFEVVPSALVDQEKGLADLERGGDGTIISVTQTDQIKEIALNTRNMDGWGALKAAEFSDAAYIIGIPPTQTSAGHPKFKSATEVAEIAAAYDIRLDDMREKVADWYEAVVTDLGENIQAFQEESQMLAVAGEPVKVTPDSISNMRFRYEVQLSEGMPENQKKRLERFSALYQMIQNEPLLDRRKILEELIRSMGESNPKYYMAIPEEEAPGNIPTMDNQMPAGPEAGAQAMAPGMDEAMMMGGMPGGMGGGAGGGDMAQLMALLGGGGGGL